MGRVPTFVFLGISKAMAEVNRRQAIETRVRDLVAPLVVAEGMELVEVEFLRERDGWVLRLFIDKAGGVGLDDCTRVSQAVGTVLDVEDAIDHEYRLEVSSPGLNRPLTRPDHFRRVEGKKIRVKTFGPVGDPPRRSFVGVLEATGPDGVKVAVEGAGEFQIAFKDIAKANLEYEF